jgi:uncharacterized repeat protein (TIGR03803 family)
MAFVLVATIVATQSVQAQTFSVLYNFTGGSDGRTPYANLIEASGSLYGTTHEGGAFGYGTVFKVDASGTETVLHSFAYTDGGYPWGNLLRDAAGNLYGTTKAGGTFGYGAVFKVDASGNETVLHNFAAGADGISPYGGLIRDPAGNLYGTTYGGFPNYGYGTVFKVDRSGIETVLYTFTGGAGGGKPLFGSMVRDAAGNLYGATSVGGTGGDGTVFKVDPSGTEAVLHTFYWRDDGWGISPIRIGRGQKWQSLRHDVRGRRCTRRNGVQGGYERQRDLALLFYWGSGRSKSDRRIGPGAAGQLLRHNLRRWCC